MVQLSNKERRTVKVQLTKSLNSRIQTLTCEMQDILIDDLVSAFESRLEVLSKAQEKAKLVVIADIWQTEPKLKFE